MITLFFISLFVILGMLAFKVFEIKVRKIHFVSNLYIKGDHKIHAFADRMFATYERYEKIAQIFVFEFIPGLMYELLTKTKDFVAKKYYESADHFRGKRILKSTGSVSFFLERLSEETSRNQ